MPKLPPSFNPHLVTAWRDRFVLLQQHLDESPDHPPVWLWHIRSNIAAYLLKRYLEGQPNRHHLVEALTAPPPANADSPLASPAPLIPAATPTDPRCDRPRNIPFLRARLVNISAANAPRTRAIQQQFDQHAAARMELANHRARVDRIVAQWKRTWFRNHLDRLKQDGADTDIEDTSEPLSQLHQEWLECLADALQRMNGRDFGASFPTPVASQAVTFAAAAIQSPLNETTMSNLEQKMASLNIALPTLPSAFGAYVPAKRVGDLIYISGQLPMKDGKLLATGQVPSKCPIEQAQVAARQCVINALAAVRSVEPDLGRLKGVVRVGCFVSCDNFFTAQPQVANGASEFLIELFGDAGKHVRAAVGVNTLPLDASVEIEFVFETDGR